MSPLFSSSVNVYTTLRPRRKVFVSHSCYEASNVFQLFRKRIFWGQFGVASYSFQPEDDDKTDPDLIQFYTYLQTSFNYVRSANHKSFSWQPIFLEKRYKFSQNSLNVEPRSEKCFQANGGRSVLTYFISNSEDTHNCQNFCLKVKGCCQQPRTYICIYFNSGI
jgi:hypothetical protein